MYIDSLKHLKKHKILKINIVAKSIIFKQVNPTLSSIIMYLIWLISGFDSATKVL